MMRELAAPPTRSSKGRGLVLAALLAFAPVGLAQPADAQPRTEAQAPRGVPVREVTSPGGVKAWLVSDSTVPMIVLRAYWHGGSSNEADAQRGATSMMADMLTEGAGDFDANAFKQRLETLNMSLGFSAGADGVSLSLTTLSDNRDAAFEMARLALHSPRFDAAPFERIKRQWAVAIRQRATNPRYIANLAFDQAMLGEHPYARRESVESVAAIDRVALIARKTAILARDNLDITVVGDISAEDLGPLLDAVFAPLPATSAAPLAPQAQVRPPTPLIVRELPQPQSLIIFGGPGVQDEDPDWIPLAVANYVLGGGGFSSRLMNEVREERGLVYGIGTGPSVQDGVALVRGSAQTENANVREAIEVTRAEIARFYADGVTQTEVNDAITYLTGSFALDLDSNTKIASVVHGYQAAGRDIDYINRRNDLIRAVTLEDVNRVVRRLFDPANFTFVIVGQPEGLDTPATN